MAAPDALIVYWLGILLGWQSRVVWERDAVLDRARGVVQRIGGASLVP